MHGPRAKIVVDADVARAASSESSDSARALCCCTFLDTLRRLGHFVCMNPTLSNEWCDHAGSYASTWLVKMENIKKVDLLDQDTLPGLKDSISNSIGDPNVRKILLKDAHLVNAALRTQKKIASMDNTARSHYASISDTIEEIGSVSWVNPEKEEERPVRWLEEGAPIQERRLLRNYRRG